MVMIAVVMVMVSIIRMRGAAFLLSAKSQTPGVAAGALGPACADSSPLRLPEAPSGHCVAEPHGLVSCFGFHDSSCSLSAHKNPSSSHLKHWSRSPV